MGPELGARDGEFFNIDFIDYPSSLVVRSSVMQPALTDANISSCMASCDNY